MIKVPAMCGTCGQEVDAATEEQADAQHTDGAHEPSWYLGDSDTIERAFLTEEQVEMALLTHHEAAHTSLCRLFEIPFEYVTLVRSGIFSRSHSGYVQVTGGAYPDKVDDEIVMMFAGLAAEEHWLSLHPWHGTVKASNGGTDTEMARQLMRRHKTSNEGSLRRRSLGVVAERWGSIGQLAEDLERRRRLSARQVSRVVRR